MHLRISQNAFLAALSRVGGVVETRTTMPILANVLIEADGDRASLFATDLETSVQSGCPAHVKTPGRITLSAKRLLDILREWNAEEIEIHAQEDGAVVLWSERSHFRIASLPPETFPNPQAIEGGILLSLSAEILCGLIRKTLFASGGNDLRYILNGLLFDCEGEHISVVAADGHRLAIVKTALPGTDTGNLQVVIPKKAISNTVHLLEEGIKGKWEGLPTLSLSKKQMTLQWGETLLISRAMDGTYPNYRNIIPAPPPQRVIFERDALIGALSRVLLLANERTYAIQFCLESGTLTLKSDAFDIGEATETLPTSYQGESLSVLFNARYLIDALNVQSTKEVALEFKDQASPWIMRDEATHFLTLIMPMRT